MTLFIFLLILIINKVTNSMAQNANPNSVQFTLVNGCPYKIYVAGAVQVNLTENERQTKMVPSVSTAQRLWANTDCDNNDNPLCNFQAAMPPISLFEWTFDADGKQTYDVSYVDGVNVPMSVKVPNCPGVNYNGTLGNSLDSLANQVPNEMKMDAFGKTRIKSVCLAYASDSVCCRAAFGTPETCGPINAKWTDDQKKGYNAMLAAFPNAYSYAYDDKIATEVCQNGKNFTIGFCTNV